jgi:hypothetical protein
MAVLAVFTPLAMLAVLVALGRYEELVLPPLADERDGPEAPSPGDGAAPRPVGGAEPPGV